MEELRLLYFLGSYEFRIGRIEMKSNSMFAMAMEAHLDGVPHIENELTAYVKLKDLYDVTSIASHTETHEQWQIPMESKKAKARIRLTDGVEYSHTIKENTKHDGVSVESEGEITKSFFEVMRRSLAKNGYLKTRHVIEIENSDRVWEIDVFKKYNGEPSLWVKLDYEFGDGETKLPEIPFDYDDIIIPSIEEGRDEEVSKLWDEEWAKLDDKDS